MDKDCTIYKTVDFIGKRWTLLILLELNKGKADTKRYSELKKSLDDITPKILSTRLKELEEQKMIKKKVDTTSIPIRCDYSLTPRGKDFIKVINKMKVWALKWNLGRNVCDSTDCENCVL